MEYNKINSLRNIFNVLEINWGKLLNYCVSQKERVRGNQRPYLKMRPLYLHFCFWFNMYTTLGCLCKNLLWITQMVLKMWLWKWTEKTQNLELLLDAADFAKFPAMEDFKHYELHKALLGRKL